MQATGPLKPSAAATIEPTGSRERNPREHSVRLTINFATLEKKFADRSWIVGVLQGALAGFPSLTGQPDSATFGDIISKTGSKVVGVEGSILCAGRPDASAMVALREVLTTAGYNLVVRELRECSHATCTTSVMIDWARPHAVPAGWYDTLVCGRHGYKACPTCNSVYVMSSANAVGQAPSFHCEVCGAVMIEWGGSKIWNAELVTRGDQAKS
jgi:hypothetical protein